MSRAHIEGGVAVITGAGSGIGAATALRFAAGGARIAAVDIDPETADVTAERCREAGVAARAFPCDVADFDAVVELAGTIEDEVGAVEVLVNNAGVGIFGPFLDASIDDWRWLRAINIDGVVHGCRAFGPAMVERGRGQVVNVASGAAYTPSRNMTAYSASKAAVLSLSQCLRADWRPHGVGVSVVCPGVIATPIASRTRYRGSGERIRSRAVWAMGKGHSPDLVARAVVSCVRRNRPFAAVGIESKLAYGLLRAAPQAVIGLLARRPM